MYRSVLVGITGYMSSAFELRRELKLRSKDGPKVVFGVYDFESLRVQSSPALIPETLRLRPAPRNAEELAQYATEVVEALDVAGRGRARGGLHADHARLTQVERRGQGGSALLET